MIFLSPMWLLGVLPWGVAAAWLLRGQAKKVDVPFLELWKGEGARRPRRALEWPPPALAAALAAMLLAVLAASRPAVRTAGSGAPVTIIVDRGITMSAGAGDDVRFRRLASKLRPSISKIAGGAAVEVRFVPALGAQRTDASGWTAIVEKAPATAVDTSQLLPGAAAEALREREGVVLVLSDQGVAIENPRLVRIAPEAGVSNVGIVRFAVRERPVRQAMVRLRNQSALSSAVLRVMSDEREVARLAADLPPEGEERDYFPELSAAGRVVMAELEVEDELSADNRAWLVRQRTWPVIEPRSPVPAEVERMVESYSKSRRATEGSVRIAVVNSVELAGNDAAVIVSAGGEGSDSGEPVKVSEHPVTRDVRSWPAVEAGAGAESALGAGWRPLVQRGGAVLVAARTDPVRQVWLGFHSPQWAATTDFVIFWSNIFDWVGEGGEEFEAAGVGALGAEWRSAGSPVEPGLVPGLYERADGAVRAVNALDVRIPEAGGVEASAAVERAMRAAPGGGGVVSMAPALLLLALVAACVAGAAWPGAGRAGGGRGVAGRVIP